jgi:YVTN family beta-propeller protein
MSRSRSTRAAALALTCALTAALGLAGPAAAQIGTRPYLAVTPNLFSNDVSILDTRTHVEVARVPVGPRPHKVAMAPSGRFAYVGEDGFGPPPIVLDEIDLVTRTLTRTLTLPNTQAHLTELEVSPTGKWLAAVDIYHARVHLVNASAFTAQPLIELCVGCPQQQSAAQVHFSNDGALLYVAVPVTQVLAVIDVNANALLKTIPLPIGTAPATDMRIVNGDDSRVYVARSGGSIVYEVDVVNDIVQQLPLQQGIHDLEPLPGSTRLATSSMSLDGAPDFLEVLDVSTQTSTFSPSSEALRALTYNPAKQELWATCHGAFGYCVPYRIDVFDAATLTQQAVLTGPSSIFVGVPAAFTPSGKHYYQPLANDTVLVIDTTTRAVVTQIVVGDNPRGVYMQGNAAHKEL